MKEVIVENNVSLNKKEKSSKMDELYLGKAEFFSFESDNWVNSFFDGKK